MGCRGTQQLRQLMGHSQFGARVVYGDCLFATVSPNEQHSALALHISRYRRNDPYVRYGDEHRRQCCTAEHPCMEARPGGGSTPGGGRHFVEDVTIELPEYDIRRAYTAQDPLAVIEAYKIEILLRLGILLGVRICPQCPRCNNGPFGCQDKFGSNMRPGGGVVGGVVALGGATEHQGHGTPHLHVEIHIACAYQYCTLEEVAEMLKRDSFSFDQWIAYHEWFHAEDVLDAEVKQGMADDLEEQWHSRFAGKDRRGRKRNNLSFGGNLQFETYGRISYWDSYYYPGAERI